LADPSLQNAGVDYPRDVKEKPPRRAVDNRVRINLMIFSLDNIHLTNLFAGHARECLGKSGHHSLRLPLP
jgi:hypothetical protein